MQKFEREKTKLGVKGKGVTNIMPEKVSYRGYL